MKGRDRRGMFVVAVLVAMSIALTLVASANRSTVDATLRMRAHMDREQAVLFVESASALPASSVPRSFTGPGWIVTVAPHPGGRTVEARVGAQTVRRIVPR